MIWFLILSQEWNRLVGQIMPFLVQFHKLKPSWQVLLGMELSQPVMTMGDSQYALTALFALNTPTFKVVQIETNRIWGRITVRAACARGASTSQCSIPRLATKWDDAVIGWQAFPNSPTLCIRMCSVQINWFYNAQQKFILKTFVSWRQTVWYLENPNQQVWPFFHLKTSNRISLLVWVLA